MLCEMKVKVLGKEDPQNSECFHIYIDKSANKESIVQVKDCKCNYGKLTRNPNPICVVPDNGKPPETCNKTTTKLSDDPQRYQDHCRYPAPCRATCFDQSLHWRGDTNFHYH